MRNYPCWTTLAATVGGLTLLIAAAGGAPQTKSKSTAQKAKPVKSVPLSFHDKVNQAMGLADSEIIQLNLNAAPNNPLVAEVAIGGLDYTLDLKPHSVRAPNYQLIVQGEAGVLEAIEPDIERTLRGTVIEMPDSVVAASLMDTGLHATIWTPAGERISLEPIAPRLAGAAPNQYVLYHIEDVIADVGDCGNNDAWEQEHALPAQDGIAGTGPLCEDLHCTEHAADADYEYFLDWGSVYAVEHRINHIMNVVDIQYERDVCIRHLTTAIVVRTTSNDPYTQTSSSGRLGQFRAEWLTKPELIAIAPDVAQLFTGINLDGDVIGQAYTIGGICTGSKFCICQSDFSTSFSCATDLTAHELGHLWGTHHCGCPASTMFPSIMCANNFNLAPETVTQIILHRDSRTCTDVPCEIRTTTLPFFDDFPDPVVDPDKWNHIDGLVWQEGTAQGPQNVPSPPYALNLAGSETGGDNMETSTIPLEGGSDFTVSYHYQRTGSGDSPEVGDFLVIEYLDQNENWIFIDSQAGDGPDMTTFLNSTIDLGLRGPINPLFRMRVRAISSQVRLDDWFIDDFSITYVPPPPNHKCGSSIEVFEGSIPFTTIGAITDGPDESGDCTFGAQSILDHDVWYVFESPCGGDVTVSLCDADFASGVAVYGGSCPAGAGEVIGCDDGGGSSNPSVTFSGVKGNDYLIRIGGIDGEWGVGTLSVLCSGGTACVCATSCEGDIEPAPNGNGAVDVDDLGKVFVDWGTANCPADIDGDGVVGVDDLGIIFVNWGPCPSET